MIMTTTVVMMSMRSFYADAKIRPPREISGILSRMRSIRITAFLLFIALVGGGAYWWHVHGTSAATSVTYQTSQEAQNIYVRFDMEAYDDIKASYWQSAGDPQLSQLFQLSLEKAAGTSSEPLATTTRSAVAQMLGQAFSGLSTTSQQQL